jgi:hypothetical protein
VRRRCKVFFGLHRTTRGRDDGIAPVRTDQTRAQSHDGSIFSTCSGPRSKLGLSEGDAPPYPSKRNRFYPTTRRKVIRRPTLRSMPQDGWNALGIDTSPTNHRCDGTMNAPPPTPWSSHGQSKEPPPMLLTALRYRPGQWIAPTSVSTRSCSPIVVHGSQDK